MSGFYIKKKVSLGFLGDEYKDAYLTFKAVPVSEYEEIFKNTKSQTNIGATKAALELVKNKFIEGKFINEEGQLVDVDAKDLDAFMDEKVLNECYETILGQKSDPKS